MKRKVGLLAVVLMMLSAMSALASAGELIVLSGQGSLSGARDVGWGFEQATGHKVTVSLETPRALNRKLESNAPADLVTGVPELIVDLVKRGKVVAGSAAPFMIAGIGVSVKAGAPKPDISTVETFKAAMLAAKSIGYSPGCSGQHAADAMQQLGIADQIMPKVTITRGGPVAEHVASGEVEIGIQQTNILVGVPGSDYVGPLPAAINRPCPFSVGLMAISKQPDLARQLIRFMTSPAAAPLLAKSLLEPARP
jgi:molybdate transport system substrate-binding protein